MGKVVIFDFDGTCTKQGGEADKPFMHAHATQLAGMLGKPVNWLLDQYDAARELVVANPSEHGWVIGGQIIAPAMADATVEAQVLAQLTLKELGEDVEAWRDRLQTCYADNYLKHTPPFRTEMLEVFNALRARDIPFYIVTNSDPVKVQKRLETLGDAASWIGRLVRGLAKKYVVTPGPEHVVPTIEFPGLKRPIFLRKQNYHDVLVPIMKMYGAYWDDLIVIGDIAELDLALPVTCGATGYLLRGANTPTYELAWAESHPRVSVIDDLHGVEV